MDVTLQNKYDNLVNLIAGYGSVAVAFSGGTDSTLLAKVAHDTLGEHMVAVTVAGTAVPQSAVADARAFAAAP